MTPLQRVARAAEKAAQAREAFEQAIMDAHPDASIREIAAAAGLSSARVHQILHGK